jgi:predicted transcriptional regulator
MQEGTEDVLSYFGGSPSRLATLEALTESELSVAELGEAVGISRTTLWRHLVDLSERGWVRETTGKYEATAAGRVVHDRLAALQDAAAVVEELGDLFKWLPLEEIPVPVERLAGAQIVRPGTTNPEAPMRLALRQIEGATDIRILTRGYSPWVVEALYDPVLASEKSVSAVVTAGVLDAFAADDSIRVQVREMVESGGFRLYRTDEIPFVLAIFDGIRLGLGIEDDQGRPQAVLDIEDQPVLDWAVGAHSRYRERATPVEADRFTD